jgi:hypothetical protein
MDILPASTKSDWWTVLTDNNPIKGPNLKDNINLPAFEKLQAQLVKAKTVPKQIELWQAFLKNPANINEAGMPITKKALNTWMTDGKMPSNVQAALSKNPLAPLPALAQAQLTYDKTDPTSVKNYETALKDTYGNLKKADGTPEFTPAYLESVAAGTIPQDTFDTRINNIAVKAATADLKTQGISLADVGGAEGLASSGKLAEYLNDSTKLASAYTSTPTAGSTVTGGAGNDTVPNEGITALGPYSGSISEVNTPAKMKQAVDNYDPNKGVYRAPSLDASGKLVANSTSPYSNILNGMLSGYKNPYAADYTNQLKMPETPDLTNIKKSFENNPTSKDLLKLANTAGQPYDPNAQTSLSPALSKIYQPSITNSAGKATKPGAPDTTNTTLPVVPKAGEPIVTDTSAGKVVTPPVVNSNTVVNPNTVDNPVIPSVTPPAPFTVDSTTSYERDDISPEVRAALDARAITDAKNAIVGDTITANDNLVKGIVSPNIASSLSTNNMNTNVTGVNGEAGIPSVLNPTTTPGKPTFQEDDGVVVSAEERANNLEAARIAQEALAKRQAEEKAEADRQAGLVALANQQAADKAAAEWDYNTNKAREETVAWEARQKALEVLAAQQNNTVTDPKSYTVSGGLELPKGIGVNTLPTQIAAQQNNTVTDPKSYTVSGGLELPKGIGVNTLPTQIAAQQNNTVTDPKSYTVSGGLELPKGIGVNTLPTQTNLGPLNISNLGAVIGPQAMNSNAGGVASLVGPQVTVQPQPQPAVTYTYAPSSEQQLEDTAAMQSFINPNSQSVAPAVTQQPAVQASAVPSTQVLDSSGTPIPGRRRLGFA